MTTKKVKKPRNRAAQDVTLINLRALKKRVEALERRMDFWDGRHTVKK